MYTYVPVVLSVLLYIHTYIHIHTRLNVLVYSTYMGMYVCSDNIHMHRMYECRYVHSCTVYNNTHDCLNKISKELNISFMSSCTRSY